MGHTSRGKFRGFKLDAAVNQSGLPLGVIVTAGNRFDGPYLPRLIEDLEESMFWQMALAVQRGTLRLLEG